MPKIKLTDFEQKKLVARVTIKRRMELKQITVPSLSKRLNSSRSAIYNHIANPDLLRLSDLWGLVSILGLSDQEILQVVRGKEDV